MLSKEEIESYKKSFERNLEILSRKMIGTATEITIIEQPIILLFNELIRRIEELETQNTDLQKSVEQIYSDYQDAGKKMFDYADKVEEIEKALKVNLKAIRKEDTFSGKTVKAFLKSILKTIKGGAKKC